MGQRIILHCDRCGASKPEMLGDPPMGDPGLRGVELRMFMYGPIWDSMKGKFLIDNFKGEICDGCAAILMKAVYAFRREWLSDIDDHGFAKKSGHGPIDVEPMPPKKPKKGRKKS